MTATLEHIKSEIRSLDPHLVEVLLNDLQAQYAMPDAEEDEPDAEAAWEAEIAERLKDVEEGRVELISGEEAELQLDPLFGRSGVQRRQWACGV
jgi:predicted transcriptional regulator